ncbi:hypothetical protein IEQ34_018631 [Dendrobium chrysotoxum]|uniref:RING-CH-type domain-containing protein n=1 Tax=Dendrobium chrysotoxum TaxID=161865 RepID=A0AAV7G551_DENCH|nr:hypothetical protein IEQ34_018631 [Dendrobium chrysotoxum]
MEFANSEEIRATGSSSSSFLLCLCRICHEEEEQGTTSMESPCACSGTLKLILSIDLGKYCLSMASLFQFAHRGCIQRWCDEKGSTVCEICLEKFEPGYTVTAPSPATPHMIEVVITIRGSLEAARLSNEIQNPAMVAVSSNRHEQEHAEHSPASYNSKSCFQSIVLMFTIMFLLRHIVAVILVGSDHYSTRLSLVILLRAVGFLLPFYLMIQLITIIRNAKRHQQLNFSTLSMFLAQYDEEYTVILVKLPHSVLNQTDARKIIRMDPEFLREIEMSNSPITSGDQKSLSQIY